MKSSTSSNYSASSISLSQDNMLSIRSELTKYRTLLFSVVGLVFGLVLLLIPYYLKADQLLLTVFTVVASFILSYSVITPIQQYFLWVDQLKQTQGVLETSLSVFQNNIVTSMQANFAWAANIEQYGIKRMYDNIPRENINAAISAAKNVNIQFVFFSYALIREWHYDALKDALTNGCTIEVLTADPERNYLIEYSEKIESYRDKHERYWAELALKRLEEMRSEFQKISVAYASKFTYRTYTSTPSIVAIAIGPVDQVPECIWFGILWSHCQSFTGPWFEIQGNGPLATCISEHIVEMKRRESSYP